VAAVAGDDVRNLHRLMNTGESLVIVRMPGEDRVRPDARLRADLIDLRQHVFAPAVVAPERIGGMAARKNQHFH
jgi:hypothetical protein